MNIVQLLLSVSQVFTVKASFEGGSTFLLLVLLTLTGLWIGAVRAAVGRYT